MPDEETSFEELSPLDLQKCFTVDDIVRAMTQCSFGARMLGEAADTIYEMICHHRKPLIIYDGRLDSRLGNLLEQMVEKGWFTDIVRPETYTSSTGKQQKAVVVGRYSERAEAGLFKRTEKAVFINQEGRAKPAQLQDGYFPDVVVGDPRYIMPVLYYSLRERLEGKRTSSRELIKNLKPYGGVASEIAAGAETLSIMIQDRKCKVFLTISGAMTIAKMGLIICDLIDQEIVQHVVSTGALMAHGLVESLGLKHYKYNPKHNDAFLAEKKINRVTDTLEPETNLNQVERVIDEVLDSVEDLVTSPRILHQLIGKYLHEKYPHERGILKSAYEKGAAVLVPAFYDSEIGNDVYIHNQKRKRESRPLILINQELDNEFLIEEVTKAEKVGLFTIGGGVPRNYVQNVAPLIEIMKERLGIDLPLRQYSYGVRLCPDPMYYGHLSGCTYSEGKSWRKMDIHGQFSEIHADATQVLPFLVKYIIGGKERKG